MANLFFSNSGFVVVAGGIAYQQGWAGNDQIVVDTNGRPALSLERISQAPGKVTVRCGEASVAIDADGFYVDPVSGGVCGKVTRTVTEIRALLDLDAAGDFENFDGGSRGTLTLEGNREGGEGTAYPWVDGDVLVLVEA